MNQTILPFIDLGGTWHITLAVGLMLVCGGFIHTFWGGTKSIWGQFLLFYVMIQCIYLIEYPKAHFGIYTPSFQGTAAQALIEVILIPFTALYFHDAIKKLIPFLALFATVCVWLEWPGLLHAGSFNMALAAFCIPMIPEALESLGVVAIASPILIGLIGLTAITHHGSTALFIIGAQLFILVIKKKLDWRWFLYAGLAGILLAVLLKTHPFSTSQERVDHWIEYLKFWRQNWTRMIFGSGPGSFIWYSIMNHPYQTGFFLQMHNEFLQILWESGVVGFGIAVGFCCETVKRAWNQEIVSLLGVVSALVFALTYEPLRFYPTALLTAFYFVRIF